VRVSPDHPNAPQDVLDQTRRLLVELCEISSASGDAAGSRRVAERLAAELERRGLRTEIAEAPDADGVMLPTLIARGPAVAERHLLVVGHLDTVLPAIPPRLDGDRLLATGALDMKGGLAMLIGALDLLARRGRQAPGDLLVVVVPDEETGGLISENAVRRWSEHARAVLVIEPGERRGAGETLVAGRRGLAEWRLEVTGTPSHSGLAFWQGRSALIAAADWAVKARALARPGEGPTVNVARVAAGTTDFVDNRQVGFDLLGTSRQRNVVPERAVVEGEVRFLSPADRERMLAALAELAAAIAAEHGVSADFAHGMTVPPVDPHGPGAPLVERAVRLAGRAGLTLEVETDRGGISFPNYLADPAAIAVVDGLGPVGDGMHTRDEYLDLRSLDRRVVLLADLLETL
jgi:glutamate carboxypeptidase